VKIEVSHATYQQNDVLFPASTHYAVEKIVSFLIIVQLVTSQITINTTCTNLLKATINYTSFPAASP